MDAIPSHPVKERPIIFSAPMVRAILEGRKTQTRRIIKPNKARYITPDGDGTYLPWHVLKGCPYGQPGDRLWVRETFRPFDIDITTMEGPPRVLKDAGREFRADFPDSDQ